MQILQPVQILVKDSTRMSSFSVVWIDLSLILKKKINCKVVPALVTCKPVYYVKYPDIRQGFWVVYHSDQVSSLINQNKTHILITFGIL